MIETVHDGPLVLNGRAAARAMIMGVERWASEVIPRLLERRPERYISLTPPRGFADRDGQAWEQVALPARALRLRAALIFSPANLAPWVWPRNVVLLHDAAVLRDEGSFSRAYGLWHRRVGASVGRRALRVITVSEFSRQELVSLAGLDRDRVVLIRPGVGNRFRPDADAERVAARYSLQRPYVLTVGTNDRRKNLGSLSEAARRLAADGIELVWAGASRRHIVGGASVAGLRALGYVPDAELPGLYAGARAFVLPSRYEGFGLTCLEAMACGTPVVAANRGALPETCAGAALLVDADDPPEIAAVLLRAATDEELRRRLRAGGLERAAGASWERAAAAVDSLLIGLAGR